ncbi:MAG: hypothetical protein ACI8W8_003038 [Rhodothermales bacterium]|jgi:hypothetical protein
MARHASRNDTWIHELTINFEDGSTETFFIELTRTGTFVLPEMPTDPLPWTKLEHCKCPCCPLSAAFERCPAAESLETTLLRLRARNSCEVVDAVIIDGANRATTVHWQLQEVGSTFVQLAVFASSCPVGRKFKSLLRDLRPFSTSNELGQHLISKFLLKYRGEVGETKREVMDQLEPLRIVFQSLSKRLSGIGSKEGGDAVANSIINLDAFALNISVHLEEAFDEILEDLGWDDNGHTSEITLPTPEGEAYLVAERSKPTFWERICGIFKRR